MNAALQALSNCPQLTTYMLEHFEQIKPGLAKNFALLLYEIWVHRCLNEYSNYSNPKVFYDYLTPSAILFAIKSACPNFRSSAQQEDAQEFLRCFLDQMHEELKTPVHNAVNSAALTGDENSSNDLSNSETDYQPPFSRDLIDLNASNEELSHQAAHRSAMDNSREHDHQFKGLGINSNGYRMSDANDSGETNNDKTTIQSASNHHPTKSTNSTDSIECEPLLSETVKQAINNSTSDALSSQSPAHKMNNSANNLLSNSMNNYLLNEHSQITPGLGDANDELLNGMEYEKENDPNVPNDPIKLNGVNGDSHEEEEEEAMRNGENLRGADIHFNELNGFANDECPFYPYDQYEGSELEDVKMPDWDLLTRRKAEFKSIFDEETTHIDESQATANDAALIESQMNERQTEDQLSRPDDEEGYCELNCSANDCPPQPDSNGRETVDSRLDEESDDQPPTTSRTSQQRADKPEKEKIVYESIISQMFNGEILNSVQCLTCKNVSTIKEAFQDLSLPIPNKDDLLQTRQANSYLKSLESSSFSSLISGKQRLREASSSPPTTPEKVVVPPKSKGSKKSKVLRVKNGLKYRRLPDEDADHQSNSKSVPSSFLSKLHKRLAKLPTIRYLFIFLLYINYFLRAYVLYSLLSVFYWSQSNLWGPTITLSDCLDAFFSTDELKDNNMYSCEKCKKLRNGIKYMHLVKSPDILCVHFKRFRNELMFPSKISTYVSFPLKGLNISSHMMEDPKSEHKSEDGQPPEEKQPNEKQPQVSQKSDQTPLPSSQEDGSSSFDFGNNLNNRLKLKRKNERYDLVSVICHRGHYNAGHYITYALNCLDDCWYEYDDKSVRRVDENKVLNCEAYLLFFKRVTSSSLDVETVEPDELCLADEPAEERPLLGDCDEGQQANQNAETSNTQQLSFFRNFSASRSREASSGDEAYGRSGSLSKGELFRKRKYEKICGELDNLNQTNDILGDLKL